MIFRNKKLLIILILAIGVDIFTGNVEAGYFDQTSFLSKQCIRSKKLKVCRLALVQTEIFQAYAASQSMYTCQTRLIGLQSDLIMIILNPSKTKTTAFGMIEDVKKACKYI